MKTGSEKKTHPILRNIYKLRILGFTWGSIIFVTIVDMKNPTSLVLFISALLWPHVAHFMSVKKIISNIIIESEKRNVFIDSFIFGIIIYYSSFSLFYFLTMWTSTIINTFSFGSFKLFFKSTIFFLIGVLILVPFVEFKFIPESSMITNVFCMMFISSYIALSSNQLYLFILKNRKRRKEIEKFNLKIQKDLVMANKIQYNLMPKDKPTTNMTCFYKPMDEVGGDLYDFLRFRDSEKFGIFISDVSGHGIQAALITSMVKSTLLQSGKTRNDPAEFLQYIHNVLEEHVTDNYVTAFYGIYDPSDRSFIYANAGHNPPYIIHDEITQLKGASGFALAKMQKLNFGNIKKKIINNKEILPNNSKLILYTDGLTETRPVDGDDFFEYSKMFDVFMNNKKKSSDMFVEILYDELISFRKSEEFDDDICIICLDVK